MQALVTPRHFPMTESEISSDGDDQAIDPQGLLAECTVDIERHSMPPPPPPPSPHQRERRKEARAAGPCCLISRVRNVAFG